MKNFDNIPSHGVEPQYWQRRKYVDWGFIAKYVFTSNQDYKSKVFWVNYCTLNQLSELLAYFLGTKFEDLEKWGRRFERVCLCLSKICFDRKLKYFKRLFYAFHFSKFSGGIFAVDRHKAKNSYYVKFHNTTWGTSWNIWNLKIEIWTEVYARLTTGKNKKVMKWLLLWNYILLLILKRMKLKFISILKR